MISRNKFSGLQYTAEDISSYFDCRGMFMLYFRAGGVRSFSPEDPDKFRRWLNKHKITNLLGEQTIKTA